MKSKLFVILVVVSHLAEFRRIGKVDKGVRQNGSAIDSEDVKDVVKCHSNKKSYCLGCVRNTNTYGPPFEWNDETRNFWNEYPRESNCYNYATNVYTPDGVAVPGRRRITNEGRGYVANLIAGAVADGLLVIPDRDNIPSVPRSEDCNIVALFVVTRIPLAKVNTGAIPVPVNMHWFRLDRNTETWSHKLGDELVTNETPNRDIIRNPREAAKLLGADWRPVRLEYDFVTYMKTCKSRVLRRLGPEVLSRTAAPDSNRGKSKGNERAPFYHAPMLFPN